MTIENRELKLQAGGRPFSAFLAQPVEGGGPGVLLLHAWWGLKPFFKELCNRLAAEGFTALAPDLFQGHLAHTIEEAEGLLHLEQDNIEFLNDIVQASLRHLDSLTPGDRGVIGFSLGAYWSMVAGANDPRVKAVVLFYGNDAEDLSPVKACLQGHFAENDTYQPLESVRAFEAEAKSAGLSVDFHIYPETRHWFMEEDRPEYDKANAELAWQRTIDFLKESLGQQVTST